MKPIVLCILDGVGINNKEMGNAYLKASTPFLDTLFAKYPNCQLEASGKLVGLPVGQMGNSEVGHSNIGAGRIVYQSIELINNKIETKEIFKNNKILDLFKYAKEKNKKVHMMGLVSDGGVHSSMEHIKCLIDMCEKNDVKPFIHAFTDGRDTSPKSSYSFLKEINEDYIVSISGRFYAMDRDNRYERIKEAYLCLTGNCDEVKTSVADFITKQYDEGLTDEFIKPTLLNKDGAIKKDDVVIFFNFRPDRVRELGSALTNPDFNGFEREFLNIKMLTMMPVSNEVVSQNIYKLEDLKNTLGEVVANNDLKQLRIAETEKYAHVTYFLDGGKELELKNCDRILIPSPKVETYDLKPDMSALEITDKLIEVINNYDLIILNYANGDMVGHTGYMDAAIKAVETLDSCVKKLYENTNITLIITADHGNCEEMLDNEMNIITSHSTNKVPFLITENLKLKDGKLADIAPTILKLLNVQIPEEMTGELLIENL